MTDQTYTTAEIGEGFSFSNGGSKVATLTVFTDRKMAARGGLTKGKKAGTLIADDVPELLRMTAKLFEQEDGWDGVARALSGNRAES